MYLSNRARSSVPHGIDLALCVVPNPVFVDVLWET